ncbi:hypothetical protein B0H10DRAFT_1943502 [Mycena sp. CBHHK59/15]|nr:hypothetical protein B0H10DRAFT_1943502 [Mycena sp. CBHHK59/15]
MLDGFKILFDLRLYQRGHESDVVYTILKICEAQSQQASMLSASTIPSVRGSVHVESSSEADVLRVFRTVAFIRRQFAPEQIPLDDYMSLMQVTDCAQFDIGSWVRYTRRGVYCGDLAWVEGVDPYSWEYTVWLVPHLPRDSGGTVVDEPSSRAKLKRRKHSRIPQCIVLPNNLGTNANTFSYTDILEYDHRDYQYGFLVLSDVPANHLYDDHLGTTETEIDLFRGSPLYEDYSNLDHSLLSEMFATSVDCQLSYSKKRASIEVDDRVRVVSGRYLGLIGYVVEYDGRDAQLEVTQSNDGAFFIYVSGSDVLVDFQIGDLVEVCAGEYAGLTGWILTLDQKANWPQLAEHRLAPIGFQAADGDQRSRLVGAILSELEHGQDCDIALHCIRRKKIAADVQEPVTIGSPASGGSIMMPRSRADPYVNLEITIIHGDLKGYWGHVKASRDRRKKLDIVTEGRSINTTVMLSEDHVRDQTHWSFLVLIQAPCLLAGPSIQLPSGDWLRHPKLVGKPLDIMIRNAEDAYEVRYNNKIGMIREVPKKIKPKQYGTVPVYLDGHLVTKRNFKLSKVFPLTTTEFEGQVLRDVAQPILKMWGVQTMEAQTCSLVNGAM